MAVRRTARRKCNPTKHKRLASNRARQAKWVAKNRGKKRAQVRANYEKNKAAILARKKRGRAAGGKPSKKVGRPREC